LGVGGTFGFAKGGVQRSFSGILQRKVHVRAIFNEKLAQTPVPMKDGAIEIEVFTQRFQGLCMGEQKPDATDIAIISAPLDERHSAGVRRVGGMARGDVIEHQVSAPI
jgi:hypothetical protein